MKALAALIGAFLISACGTTSKPLTDKSEKSENGFAFVPPQGTGWYLHEAPGWPGHAYAKEVPGLKLRSPEHTVIFMITTGSVDIPVRNADDSLSFLRMAKESQLRNERFVTKSNQMKTIEFKGTKCLEFDSLVVDRATNQNMSMTGWSCIHPKDPRRYIDVAHSQRLNFDRKSLDLSRDADDVIRKVRFVSVSP